MAGREALCCNHLNLAYSQVCKHKPRGRRHAEASDWSSVRELIDLGLLFSAVARERHPGARTQCGHSPLHHSICLPPSVISFIDIAITFVHFVLDLVVVLSYSQCIV